MTIRLQWFDPLTKRRTVVSLCILNAFTKYLLKTRLAEAKIEKPGHIGHSPLKRSAFFSGEIDYTSEALNLNQHLAVN